MDNVLDLLYDYSKKGRKVDKEYIKKASKIIINERDLSEYIKEVQYKDLTNCKITHNEKYVPIAYNPYTKRLIVDIKNLAFFQKILEALSGLDVFGQVLLINAISTQALLHDIEHANQEKKSISQNDDFENLLLGINCHVDNEFFQESKLSKFLMLQMGIYLNSQLFHNLCLQQRLNSQFNTSIPSERMANIHSTQEVCDMLEQISKIEDIENVISLLNSLLAGHQLNGYIVEGGVVTSPTAKYLEAVKKANIAGMAPHFDEHFATVMQNAQNDILANRLLLGLDITKEEYLETEMNLSRKL